MSIIPPPSHHAASASSNGQLVVRASQLLSRAAIDAIHGHESSCREAAAEAGMLGHRAGIVIFDLAADHVLGLLELSVRNLPVAAWHLTRCQWMARTSRLIDPCVVRYEADLVEVLISLGRRPEARLVAATLTARAVCFHSPWASVAAARCRGLLADDTTFDAHFEGALLLAGGEGDPFECARTELCYGERLRRARRRVEARGHLTHALATFRAMGAAPWYDRTARELQATSGTARRRGDPSNADNLTPQEEHAARLVAKGATIREAAGQMFLSPKTVESHLGRAYRKLGVHNRAQLALALERDKLAA